MPTPIAEDADQACTQRAPKLGAAMNADQAITQAAAYAAVAYRNGDDILGAYWEERVVRLSDERERVRHCGTFDELKGSPDHAGLHERPAHA